MKRLTSIFSMLLIAIFVLAACSPNTQMIAASGGGSEKATISFQLKTVMENGKLAFLGVGGDINGKTNPDLKVKPNDVVEIVLLNGDGMMHDISLPDFDAQSDQISAEKTETRLVFNVDQAGEFPYFCSLPGHRSAGMEGKLFVGDPVAKEQLPSVSIVRAPDDLPGPLNRTEAQHIQVDLETVEVKAQLADGVTYAFWTFNGKIPGPFVRARVGDTIVVRLKNNISSTMSHSVDFHAVTGPGGGAVATQTKPGGETTFTFQALNPGIYVYHCATPMVAQHISNGMYGMILVEPENGLPKVDREFYVMQGELYTQEPMGQKGEDHFSTQKLLDERPEYFTMNGAVGGLTKDHPLKANIGETIRIYYGVGGPNYTASFHVIGEIFDRVYEQGSLTAEPLTNVQTTTVPPGGATMVEMKLQVPGRFILVDHALSRMERGLAGYLLVEGDKNPQIFDGMDMGNSGH